MLYKVSINIDSTDENEISITYDHKQEDLYIKTIAKQPTTTVITNVDPSDIATSSTKPNPIENILQTETYGHREHFVDPIEDENQL